MPNKDPWILAIDPGNKESAYCLVTPDLVPVKFAKKPNNEVMNDIGEIYADFHWCDPKLQDERLEVAIEFIEPRGMAVGLDTIDTAVWTGRFMQFTYREYDGKFCDDGVSVYRIYRRQEKSNICGSMKAKDSNIRQALVDRFAPDTPGYGKGTKRNPGFFYGFGKDIWSAFAVAVTHFDINVQARVDYADM